MKIKTFFPNEVDNQHCLQASVRMVASSVFDKEMSLKDAEEFTGFVKGLQTWPYETMLSFAEHGMEVMSIECMDHELFSIDARKAVTAEFGEEIWEHIEAVSDVELAQARAKQCVENANIRMTRRTPNVEDICKLLNDEYFVIANVNAKALLESDGYSGHFVVVELIKDEFAFLQNPGLPPAPNQKIALSTFTNAWAYPNERAANILAVKRME